MNTIISMYSTNMFNEKQLKNNNKKCFYIDSVGFISKTVFVVKNYGNRRYVGADPAGE